MTLACHLWRHQLIVSPDAGSGDTVRRGFWACCLVAALAVPASAAGYDDFTRGMTANLRGDYPAAIAAFTTALASPDLVAAYKPTAYRSRAAAYLEQDRCDEALADITSYIALKSSDHPITRLRMWANLCRKDAAGAQKDFEALSEAKPGAYSFWYFSRLEWRYGLFADAAAVATKAYAASNKKEDFAPYILLWQVLSAARAGKLDTDMLTTDLEQWKAKDWPRPILEYYLGKRTEESVQKEASSWRSSRDTAQHCEANFYIAEWHLGRGDTAAATPLLLFVSQKCPNDLIEVSAAQAELKRMGVPVPKE